MLDIKFVRENPEVVKENIKKKFQDKKLVLVDEVVELDDERRKVIGRADELRANRNKISKQIGALMAQGKKDEAMQIKEQVTAQAQELDELAKRETELNEEVTKRMMMIPNIIDESVPIGKDDSENVEVQRYGEPVVPDFEIPY
ncbi:MAG TPA: serine--tRNA ligase, partial [Ruminococcaceae bacterium]|nr:serine--tRNA ligase [Oscillospiraceae bacterium]